MSAESVFVEGVPGKALVGVTDVEVLLSEKQVKKSNVNLDSPKIN